MGWERLGEFKVIGEEVIEKVAKCLGAENRGAIGGADGEFAWDSEVKVSRYDGVGSGGGGDGAAEVVEGRGKVFRVPGGREMYVGEGKRSLVGSDSSGHDAARADNGGGDNGVGGDEAFGDYGKDRTGNARAGKRIKEEMRMLEAEMERVYIGNGTVGLLKENDVKAIDE